MKSKDLQVPSKGKAKLTLAIFDAELELFKLEHNWKCLTMCSTLTMEISKRRKNAQLSSWIILMHACFSFFKKAKRIKYH